MRRTVPLLITAAVGFVLIVAFFIPHTEKWGERAMIWFDILAAIAFVLGGGNLLKVHLQKVSSRQAGWGYSVITIAAFLVTLYVGLLKVGSSPEPNQEFYGETFVPLALDDFPRVYSVEGVIPPVGGGRPLPASVRWQLSQREGKLLFRGWMSEAQRDDLIEYKQQLAWGATVEALYAKAQPPKTLPKELRKRIVYRAERGVLSFLGHMTPQDHKALLAFSSSPRWQAAVNQLYAKTQKWTKVTIDRSIIPPGFQPLGVIWSRPDPRYHDPNDTLSVIGSLPLVNKEALVGMLPRALPATDAQRHELLDELLKRGPLSQTQRQELARVLDGNRWTAQQLHELLDEAGRARRVKKKFAEMLKEKEQGVKQIARYKREGADQQLNEQQREVLEQFVQEGDGTASRIERLVADLKAAGPLVDHQEEALRTFLAKQPTVGQRNKELCIALLRAGPLQAAQRQWLLEPLKKEQRWRAAIEQLLLASHTVKYPWSGGYRAQGTPFWWLYEYAFKPLTATMFALLAFYVASAAFRAFRAKNVEAILLLGTAFLILLGRTFAGVLLTSWLPESGPLSVLRVENLTIIIMRVFNTAGNRAIMIGIALGIASTSLKVLLGIDRSYLGSSEG